MRVPHVQRRVGAFGSSLQPWDRSSHLERASVGGATRSQLLGSHQPLSPTEEEKDLSLLIETDQNSLKFTFGVGKIFPS